MHRDFQLFRRILANDLRLYFRSGKGAAGRIGGAVFQLLMLAIVHLPVMAAMRAFTRGGADAGATEFAVLLALLLVVAAASQRSLETLYNRGDLPLLLSSPAPLRVIVATRLADITLTTLVASAVFIIPLLDCAILLHGRHWWWGWPAWVAGAALLVPLTLAATLATVRGMGGRRARVIVQLFGIALGMAAFAGFQASNWMTRPGPGFGGRLAGGWLSRLAVPPLTQLGDAARGDPLWLGLIAALGVGATVWALRRLTRDFAHGALAAVADTAEAPAGRPTPAAAWRGSFERPRWRTIVLKELRMVFRDPLLLARASTQIVTIIPGLAGAFLYRASVGLAGVALVGPAMAAALLAALMTTNDEAPDCTAASPISRRRAAVARTAAAAFYPALLGWIISGVILGLGHPLIAAITGVGATLNAAAIAWLTTCTVRPHTAEDRARNKQPMIIGQSLYGMLIGGIGAGGVALWFAEQPLVAAIMFGLAILTAGAGFFVRPRRTWAVS